MENHVLFEYYPYNTDKTIKVRFWVFFFILLSFRNRKLQIFSDHISIYSIFGNEKMYKLNTERMTIQVNYTTVRNRGFKLTFLDINSSKICSYTLLESAASQSKIKERRKYWGEGLMEVGCSIDDKGHYLLDESININHVLNDMEYVDHNQIKDQNDSCIYIRKLLKRNCIFFPLFSLFVSSFVIGFFLLFYSLNKIDITSVIAVITVSTFQLIPLTFMINKYKKMLSYTDEKLLEQDFARLALERRKK